MKKVLLFFAALLCFLAVSLQAQQRKVLFEEFTSSTCYPYCPQYNQLITPWLTQNAEKVVTVKYQMNGPGAGDPYYTAEGGIRATYYSISGVPSAFVNGSKIGGSTINAMFTNTVNAINNGYAQPAEANIEGYFTVSGNMITITGSVTPLISGSGYRLFVIVNEKMTTGNKMTNGETEFHHVMMKMFPNGNGTDVTLTSGTPIPFTYTHNMSTTHVEEMNDLEVAVFVQNTSSRAILNAAYLDPPAPRNVTAVQSAIDSKTVNISWNPPVEGVPFDGYNIYRGDVKLNTSLLSGTSFQDEAPEFGKTYAYSVVLVSGGVEGYGDSDKVLIDVTIPTPISVSVKQIRGMKMLVSWEQPETQYPVKFYLYRNNILQNPSNPLSVTTYENTGSSYIEYCFEIEPFYNDVKGAKSAKSCVTLVNVPTPANLKAQQVSPAKKNVLLTWNPSATNTVGYNVYRDNVKINTELVTEPNYLDVVAEFDKAYVYLVFGVADNGGESASAATALITLSDEMPIPKNVKANQLDNQLSVSVTWDAISMQNDGYNIYRNDEKINNEPVTENEYVDIVPEEDNYCYKISAVSETLESEKSEPDCVNVKLGIGEPSQDIFTLYPNPVSGKLFIQTNETILDCNIYNIQGQLIYSSKLDVKEIDTEGWAQNVYIIQIQTHKGLSEKRFVKR